MFLFGQSVFFVVYIKKLARLRDLQRLFRFFSGTKENNVKQNFWFTQITILKCAFSTDNIRILNFEFIFRKIFRILSYMYRYVRNKCNLVTPRWYRQFTEWKSNVYLLCSVGKNFKFEVVAWSTVSNSMVHCIICIVKTLSKI